MAALLMMTEMCRVSFRRFSKRLPTRWRMQLQATTQLLSLSLSRSIAMNLGSQVHGCQLLIKPETNWQRWLHNIYALH